MRTPVFVGIDVSHAQLDVAVRPGTRFSASNDEPGIVTVVEELRALAPTLIVLEATGSLEVPLTSALAAARLPPVFLAPFLPSLVLAARRVLPSMSSMSWT